MTREEEEIERIKRGVVDIVGDYNLPAIEKIVEKSRGGSLSVLDVWNHALVVITREANKESVFNQQSQGKPLEVMPVKCIEYPEESKIVKQHAGASYPAKRNQRQRRKDARRKGKGKR